MVEIVNAGTLRELTLRVRTLTERFNQMLNWSLWGMRVWGMCVWGMCV